MARPARFSTVAEVAAIRDLVNKHGYMGAVSVLADRGEKVSIPTLAKYCRVNRVGGKFAPKVNVKRGRRPLNSNVA